MALGDRINRLIRSNITDWKHQRKDYQRELEQTLTEFKQSVQNVVLTQEVLWRDYQNAQQQVHELVESAKLALQQHNEPLARELLTRKQSYSKQADELKQRLDELIPTVTLLEQQLAALESERDMFTASLASPNLEQDLEAMPDLDFAEIDAELELLRSRLQRL
ncbi:PspA/IM30 family protein [Laspinema olomoucense]|uniref:PspA/IM30 family protein n=1 Tax=Laspinema olomoucense TaxID=3231600 RepID=UPI0021BAC3A5|nr:PspA/IM30 family protein [Laspinema sp. D3d]MCT7974952.1 PspA/IM30 family protein [Laspinema sp. D3d]